MGADGRASTRTDARGCFKGGQPRLAAHRVCGVVAHGAERGFVIEAEGNPVLDVGMFVEDRRRGIERRFGVGLRLRRVEDVLGREAIGLEHRDGALDAVDRRRQLVIGDADGADRLQIPAALLRLIDDRLSDRFADLGRRDAHMRHLFDRIAVALMELLEHGFHPRTIYKPQPIPFLRTQVNVQARLQ